MIAANSLRLPCIVGSLNFEVFMQIDMLHRGFPAHNLKFEILGLPWAGPWAFGILCDPLAWYLMIVSFDSLRSSQNEALPGGPW